MYMKLRYTFLFHALHYQSTRSAKKERKKLLKTFFLDDHKKLCDLSLLTLTMLYREE